MIFYKIPATADQHAKLEPTQDAARAECKARGLRFNAGEMQHDVPTDKAGLLDYVNHLLGVQRKIAEECTGSFYRGMDAADAAAERTPPASAAEPPTALRRQAQPATGWGASLHSAERSDQLQGAQVDVGRQVDQICDTIGELGGYHLGNVAHAVAARFGEIERQAKGLAA